MGTKPGSAKIGDRDTDEQLVDTLQAIFGKHPGFRPAHAKGIVCEGMFNASAAAGAISRAPHLAGGAVPVTVRFSNGSGVPTLPDGDPNSSPRGMALRFHLPNGVATDIVAHSVNGFPAATPGEFLEFLRALAASGPEVTKPAPIDVFLANHPRARAFAQAPKPAPASFATESYFGVNAFRFVNRDANARYGRYQIRPIAGEQHLSADAAAVRPANFLFDELAQRFTSGPVRFRLSVQLAEDGDPVSDPSQPWPDSRAQVELGSIAITGAVTDSDAAQRSLLFDPLHLVDGIEPSDDPVLRARPEIYGISFSRRNPTA
ncbi:MAG: catalase family peroxidase [Bryobacteraceae bacterium]